jgi:hypothetical protein
MVLPYRQNFSFLHVRKTIFASEPPSLRCTILGLCGNGIRCESSYVRRRSAPCSLFCLLPRAFDSIKHGISIGLGLPFAQLLLPDRVSGLGEIQAHQRRQVSCTHQGSGHYHLLHTVSVRILVTLREAEPSHRVRILVPSVPQSHVVHIVRCCWVSTEQWVDRRIACSSAFESGHVRRVPWHGTVVRPTFFRVCSIAQAAM